jgi:hypothetical protein
MHQSNEQMSFYWWAFSASHFYMRVDANFQISYCRRPKTDRHMFLIFFNLQSSNGSNQIWKIWTNLITRR